MKRAVLVVEDHRAVREGMVEVLAHEGFVGIPAANGQEALDYLKSGGQASVIVLDLTMPVMNGWAFRQQQQGDPRLAEIPTIVLTGFESRPFDDDIPAAILQKPVDLRALIALLEVLCDSAGRVDD
jgi:CheY-like chemotaxis protein